MAWTTTRDKAIREIDRIIEVGKAILRGDIDLERINAPIPEDERWQSAEDAAHRISFESANHYIQFALNLGLVDRQKDAALIQEWGRRIGFIEPSGQLPGEHMQPPHSPKRPLLGAVIGMVLGVYTFTCTLWQGEWVHLTHEAIIRRDLIFTGGVMFLASFLQFLWLYRRVEMRRRP